MRTIWIIAALLCLVTVVLLLGSSQMGKPPVSSPKATARQPLYYRDPMHPTYTSKSPGRAPDCGMDLEPVYSDEPKARREIRLSAEQQQLIGLQVGSAERSAPHRVLRTVGRVTLDERRIFPVTTGAEGWVTQVLAGTTGELVHKNQPLAVVYGREYTTAQRTYLFALKASENAPPTIGADYQDSPSLTLNEARITLQNLGIGDSQISELNATRRVSLDITLLAPADGYVVSRNVYPKQKYDRGEELYRIADMSRVWIEAALIGEDARAIHPPTAARVTLQDQPGMELQALASDALAQFDQDSRTLKLRLEVENRGLNLRPGMLVDLEFPLPMRDTISVPVGAVVDSGLHQTVFVAKGDGVFEAREVETGWRSRERIEIVRGLSQGEEVVVSGNFLLDSESRMKASHSSGHD